jgi:hypothetical protein
MMKKRRRNWFRKKKKASKPLYRHVVIEEEPTVMERNMVYIFNNVGYHWQLTMLCPCGCGDVLYANLIPDHYPNWVYRIDRRDLISVYPSFHRKDRCRSHFFIRNGRIDWINDRDWHDYPSKL